jgi:RHH-type proline utilization regulon transcriptional repressor/proline dehydrogenase/delta 1-pyrroline-5-carboxylate dehydrogenase
VLVAETGGLNAMIVDSSALPEQVVADAITSAFDSAGQRCSALRLLCLQDDIADRVLPMLRGAMQELRLGDPRRLAVDVGPVIDEEARAKLAAHVAHWQSRAHVYSLPLPAECASGTFVAPTIVEIDSARDLTREVFGPVLHVTRYREGELGALIDAINAAGYGLTHGIHTRIDETVDFILQRIRAGNVYVNRNMIGAVVGVQPFGGEGLSGTGPKAGGPNYLGRLVRESRPPQPPAGAALLTGPTGESNTLTLHPRGRVACIADSEAERAAQADLARSLGNDAVATLDPAPDAVLFSGSAAQAEKARAALARDDGAIVPFVTGREGRYDAARLVAERTLTINTTASGGNASLLSLEESEPA